MQLTCDLLAIANFLYQLLSSIWRSFSAATLARSNLLFGSHLLRHSVSSDVFTFLLCDRCVSYTEARLSY